MVNTMSALSKIGLSGQVSLSPCLILKVNDNLTADIYIQQDSSTVYGVPFCFPSKGDGYGSYFMPKEGGNYLVAFSSNRKPYILVQAPLSLISQDSKVTPSEKLLAAENLIQSIGGAYLKQDTLGNSILSSGFGNSLIQDNLGVNRSFSLGSEEIDLSHKSISGIGFPDQFESTNLKLVGYEEYYSQIQIPKVYKVEELLGLDGSINQTIKTQILADATSIINIVSEFKIKMLQYKLEIQNMQLSDSDLADLATSILSQVEGLKMPKSGVKVIIEKGNALNKELSGINEVSSLKSTDFEKSEQDNDICLRISLKDIDTGDIKARMQIDTEGNCEVKFKTLKITTEPGGYSLEEV